MSTKFKKGDRVKALGFGERKGTVYFADNEGVGVKFDDDDREWFFLDSKLNPPHPDPMIVLIGTEQK